MSQAQPKELNEEESSQSPKAQPAQANGEAEGENSSAVFEGLASDEPVAAQIIQNQEEDSQ